MLLACVCGAMSFWTIVYLVPVAIMCMCGRESNYERGWVETMYLSLQVGLATSKSKVISHGLAQSSSAHTVVLAWSIVIREPDVCGPVLAGEESRTSNLSNYQSQEWFAHETYDVCQWLPGAIVLATLQLLTLILWFGWTLWIATKAAKMRGEGWTRSKVLRKMGMSQVCKVLHSQVPPEAITMDKLGGEA